jgi:hypothetical protein
MILRPGHLAILTFATLLGLGWGALGAKVAPAPPLHLVLRAEAPDVLEAQSLRAEPIMLCPAPPAKPTGRWRARTPGGGCAKISTPRHPPSSSTVAAPDSSCRATRC